MRGALEDVAGITKIETDPTATLCTFEVTDSGLDVKAKLDELAESPEKQISRFFKEYTIVN